MVFLCKRLKLLYVKIKKPICYRSKKGPSRIYDVIMILMYHGFSITPQPKGSTLIYYRTITVKNPHSLPLRYLGRV